MKENYWNHRILAKEYKGEIHFEIHEVYYENGKPMGRTKNPVSVGGENIKAIRWVLKKMKKATKKPILWGDDRFPLRFK